MVPEGQADEQDLDLGLVVLHGVVPFVFGEDGVVGGLVHDAVAVGVRARGGRDALVPEPFVSGRFGPGVSGARGRRRGGG